MSKGDKGVTFMRETKENHARVTPRAGFYVTDRIYVIDRIGVG